MDVIKPFQSIYNLFGRMKSNNQQCPHVLERLKAVEKLVLFISKIEPDQLSDDINKALEKLNKVLSSATELIKKFTEAYMVTQMVKSTDYKFEFDKLNKSLTDAFVTLSAALHVQQGKKLDKQENMLAEQQNVLHEQENMLHEQENMLHEQENVLHEQKKRLAEQERKLAQQEYVLQRVESKLEYESNKYYCILQ